MARNFISIFSTVFFFVMIIVASFTPQMALGAPKEAWMDDLVDSSTVSKNIVQKPNIDVSGVIGLVTKVADPVTKNWKNRRIRLTD
ncbi:hypothetical protein MKX03_035414 [Papaver bracteatum]|nr:hypothetical protein MKX03_035414 [Papaver bracteatum]